MFDPLYFDASYYMTGTWSVNPAHGAQWNTHITTAPAWGSTGPVTANWSQHSNGPGEWRLTAPDSTNWS